MRLCRRYFLLTPHYMHDHIKQDMQLSCIECYDERKTGGSEMIKSRCGTVCDPAKCKEAYQVDCPGCVAMDKPFWGVCEVKVCCEGKGLEHCGLCADIP